jgi:hypothetical protein
MEACQSTLSWPSWIQSATSHLFKVYFNNTLPTTPTYPKISFPSGFLTKILYVFLTSKCPIYLILLDLFGQWVSCISIWPWQLLVSGCAKHEIERESGGLVLLHEFRLSLLPGGTEWKLCLQDSGRTFQLQHERPLTYDCALFYYICMRLWPGFGEVYRNSFLHPIYFLTSFSFVNFFDVSFSNYVWWGVFLSKFAL